MTLSKQVNNADRVCIVRNDQALLQAYEANTFITRLKGLFAYPPLGACAALVLRDCTSVHTFGLSQRIDAVFVGKQGTVLKIVSMKRRSVAFCFKASCVVEMQAGSASRLELRLGQRLMFERQDLS